MSLSFEHKKIQLAHFENLVAVAWADKCLDEEEQHFLSAKAREFGLTEQEVAHTLQRADQLAFVVPQNEADQEEQLSDAVYMSMVNGTVHAKEYALCVHLAYRLGLEKKDVDHIIALVAKLWKLKQEKEKP